MAFLRAAADFTASSELPVFEQALEQLESLPGERGHILLSLVMDRWMREDRVRLDRFMTVRWASVPTVVHWAYLSKRLIDEPAQTSARLLDPEDPAYQYLDDFMVQLVTQSPETVAAFLGESKDTELRREWAGFLLQNWMATAPDNAIRWAQQFPGEVDFVEIFMGLLYSGDASDSQQLMELWKQLPKAQRTAERQQEIAEMLVYQNPEAALVFIEGLPATARYPLLHRVIERLASEESAKAAELLRSLPVDHLPRAHTIKNVLLAWGLRETDAAMTWARALPDGELRDEALGRMNTVLAMIDPQLAIDDALATPPGPLQVSNIRNVALFLARKDLVSGIEWVDALPESAGKRAALNGINHLINERMFDASIMSHVQQLKPSSVVDGFADQVFFRWCSQDIAAASTWYFAQPESDQNNSRTERLAMTLVQGNPEAALDYFFDDASSPYLREKIFSHFIRDYQAYPEITQQLAEGIHADYFGTVLPRESLRNLGQHDPGLALRMASQLPEKERMKEMTGILQSWSRSDPIASARYLQTEEIWPSRQHLYNTAAENLAAINYEQAVAWVDALPNEQSRLHGTIGLAARLGNTDPLAALNMLEALPTGDDRSLRRGKVRVTEQILKNLAYYDASAAVSAIEASAFSEKQEARFQKAIREMTTKF